MRASTQTNTLLAHYDTALLHSTLQISIEKETAPFPSNVERTERSNHDTTVLASSQATRTHLLCPSPRAHPARRTRALSLFHAGLFPSPSPLAVPTPAPVASPNKHLSTISRHASAIARATPSPSSLSPPPPRLPPPPSPMPLSSSVASPTAAPGDEPG